MAAVAALENRKTGFGDRPPPLYPLCLASFAGSRSPRGIRLLPLLQWLLGFYSPFVWFSFCRPHSVCSLPPLFLFMSSFPLSYFPFSFLLFCSPPLCAITIFHTVMSYWFSHILIVALSSFPALCCVLLFFVLPFCLSSSSLGIVLRGSRCPRVLRGHYNGQLNQVGSE